MKKQFLTLMFGLVAGCMLFPGKAMAANKSLKAGKVYQIDLDGDSINEKIKYTYKAGEEKSKITVYVNGKKQFTANASYSRLTEIYITDFDKSDSKKDLYIGFAGDSDCLTFSKILQYENNKLAVVSSRKANNDTLFCGRRSLADTQKGDGTVTFCADTPFFASGLYCYYVNMDYRIEHGTLVKCKQNLYEAADFWKTQPYTLNKNITFTTKRDGKKTAFKAKKGDQIFLNAIYCKSEKKPVYVQMKTKSGKIGWYKVTDEKFFDEEYAWG